ncbi:glycosyltransferase 87 family protein [Naasia lichenicola]|uniref:glycosyltransferase 87 family protein n=1 Tax=Naasia lichenicola TaxID=2565933 RepID=UPI00130DDF3F|nr:glycosyltransferase 87 family protein [Naasia lichenicola]
MTADQTRESAGRVAGRAMLARWATSSAGRRFRTLPIGRLLTPRAFWAAFGGFQLMYFAWFLPVIVGGGVLGDLPLYRLWAMQTLHGGTIPGVTADWVYPLGALSPILLAGLAGSHWFQLSWLVMTAALDAAASAVLLARGGRRSIAAAWWWLGILFLLSPVALLRLEGVAAPLGLIGLLLIARRPWAAGVLLSVAAWIKVWPIAVLGTMLTSARTRLPALLSAVAVSAILLAVAIRAGGLTHFASFLTAQTGRALQLEAPVTTPWLWAEWLGASGVRIYQNMEIATREVVGPGTNRVAGIMTPLMAIAVALILLLVILARRGGRDPMEILLSASLAIVAAMIVFNKVGSPQYVLWLVPVCAAGLVLGGRRWKGIAILVGVIATMTTLIFPVFYLNLIELQLGALLLLSGRNALLISLFGVAVWQLAALAVPSALRGREPALVLPG